ncbi:MAG: alpha/beta fold hydrolase [Kofleriaceae bacterium]|nr:alpha/beta fold hydrolase [Kofleriaceae bacterium]
MSSYNTAYNADDVDDLRSTLGYEKLNIYGISYGSRLALEVLRRHGEHIRSAVVGGLVPSQIVWTAGIPAGIDGALTNLNQSCVAAGACGVAYGDLYAEFIAGVYDLQENPISLDNGAIDLDGSTYASLLFRLMYSRSSYPWLPMVISDLAARQTGRIDSFLVNAINAIGNSSVARGMYYSVVCGEMFSPPDPNAFEALNVGVPQDMQDIFGGGYYYSREICRTWPNGPLQASLAAPVISAVPTFVASGEMDPVTPPYYGQIAGDTLSDSLVVIYANSGHGSTLQTECGRQTFLAFLANPDTEMDVSCAETLTTEYILPSSAAPVAQLSQETLAMELQLAPAPPHMMDAIRRAIKN